MEGNSKEILLAVREVTLRPGNGETGNAFNVLGRRVTL